MCPICYLPWVVTIFSLIGITLTPIQGYIAIIFFTTATIVLGYWLYKKYKSSNKCKGGGGTGPT